MLAHLKGQVQKEEAFENRSGLIHVANGVLDLGNGSINLLPFSPKLISRNLVPIHYEARAKCNRFKKELLGLLESERKYVVTGNGSAAAPPAPNVRKRDVPSARKADADEAKPKLRKRYVKRGVAWRGVKDVAVKVGEPVFVRIGPANYEEIGRVQSDGKLPVGRL